MRTGQMGRWLGGVIVIAAGLVICGCGSGGSGGARTLHGTVNLIDYTTAQNSCVGQGGFDDIAAGADVTVKDASSTIVGTTTLGDGAADSAAVMCTYHFAVDKLPSSATFYSVQIGHRNAVTYSQDDLNKASWSITLTLGG